MIRARRNLALAVAAVLAGLLLGGGALTLRSARVQRALLGAADSERPHGSAAGAPRAAADEARPGASQGAAAGSDGERTELQRSRSTSSEETRKRVAADASSPAGRVVVLDADRRPLPTAIVEVLDDELSPVWTRPVDERGVRRLEARGRWVRARAPGHATSDVHGFPRSELVLTLQPAGAVQGRVIDGEGQPLAGVQVAVARSLTTSDERGAFELSDVLPGRHRLWLSSPGRYQEPPDGLRLTVVPGRTTAVTGTLLAGGAILGRVVDASGRPQAEVRLVLSGQVSRLARSDGRGRFRLDGVPPGEHRLEADRGADVLASAVVRLDSPQDRATVELTIPPGRTLRGRILDASGAPVEDARVRAVAVRDGGLSLEAFTVGLVVRTTADGRFAIPGLPGGSYRAEVALDDEGPFLPASEPQPVGDLPLEAEVPPTRELRGLVTDAAGRPIAGAVVEATTGTVRSTTRTDAHGGYRLIAPEGSATVRANAPGYAPTSAPAASFLTLSLAPAASLRVRVVDDGGAPYDLPDADLLNVVPAPRVTVTGPGELRLAPLAPGPATLRVGAAGAAAPVEVQAVVDAEREVLLTVRLPRLLGLAEGVVFDADGDPLGGVRLTSGAQRTQTDTEGRFSLPVPSEGVDVLVRKRDHAPLTQRLYPGAVTLVLQRGFRVRGVARTLSGQPVGGLELVVVEVVGSDPTPLRRTQTEPDGRFELRNLPPGTGLAWRLPGERQGHLLPLDGSSSDLVLRVDDPATVVAR